MSEFTPVLLTLPSLTPSLAIEVLPYGLTVHRIYAQADGKTHDLVIGPENPADHVHKKYNNTIVGRYANRIPAGSHTIIRDGITSSLTAQPNESERVSLHGGPQGWDSVAWTRIAPSAAQLFTSAELAHLPPSAQPSGTAALFRLVSPAGMSGFPGTVRSEVLFTLAEGSGQADGEGAWTLGSVIIIYRAKLQEDNVLTPINLTQHWGFNLDASLKEGERPEALSVKDHKLSIKAASVIQLDKDALATGETTAVTEDPSHNHDGKNVGERAPPRGYDDYYVLTPRSSLPDHYATRVTLSPAVDVLGRILNTTVTEGVLSFSGSRSGLTITFDTNQSGVMFYSNIFADGRGARKKIHGGSGVLEPEKGGYEPFSAGFIEFHEPVAAFLNTALQQRGDDTILGPGQIYNNWVRLDVRYQRPT